MLWLLLFACHAGTPPESTAGAPTELHGEKPAAPVTVPDFAAVDQDGQPRSKADLLGHPTVVWFFPAAGTPG